jgi:hypothetical protein
MEWEVLLPLRGEWRHVEVDAVWRTFRANGGFAGVAWLEGPEKGPTRYRAADLYIAKDDGQAFRFFTHGGETSVVRVCAMADEDWFSCPAVENRERLRTTGEQENGEQKE